MFGVSAMSRGSLFVQIQAMSKESGLDFSELSQSSHSASVSDRIYKVRRHLQCQTLAVRMASLLL